MGLSRFWHRSSIPGFWPPAEIGAQPFVDGGVLMNTPLKLAIDAGADTLHVIHLDPQVKDIPIEHIENTLGALVPHADHTMGAIFDQ